MSNVLIGIIGVILFIGLALAGALILGDDFQSASSSSKAATIVQGLQQVSNAYAMNTIKSGSTISADQGDNVVALLVASRRLKTAPVNPMATGSPVIGYDDIGQRNATKPMGTIVMPLGAKGPQSLRDVCYAIEEQMGASNPAASVDTITPYNVKVTTDKRVGCLWNTYSNSYMAYAVL